MSSDRTSTGIFFPFTSPRVDHNRIHCTPFFFQAIKFQLCCFFRDSFIHTLQIFHKLFLMLGSHIFERISNLMYDTELDLCLRKNTVLASGKPFNPSTDANSISSTPRFCRSVSTCNQKLAPSFSEG